MKGRAVALTVESVTALRNLSAQGGGGASGRGRAFTERPGRRDDAASATAKGGGAGDTGQPPQERADKPATYRKRDRDDEGGKLTKTTRAVVALGWAATAAVTSGGMSTGVVLWGDNNLPWSERRAEIHVEGLEFAPAAAISSRPGRFIQLQEDGSSASQPQEDSGAERHASQPLPGFSCPHKVLFFLTYLLYIAVNTVNGPLMPAMKVSLNFTSGEGATIAAVQTVGISAGKLVYGGWPVDVCGARRTYVASMLAVGALACAYSLMSSYGGIALIAFLVEFLSTPVYPCHVQLIRGWMPVEEAARGFWLLGLSSRTGDVLSKLCYGSLLAVMSWQQLTWCAAGVALGAALLGGLGHRDSPSARDAPGEP